MAVVSGAPSSGRTEPTWPSAVRPSRPPARGSAPFRGDGRCTGVSSLLNREVNPAHEVNFNNLHFYQVADFNDVLHAINPLRREL